MRVTPKRTPYVGVPMKYYDAFYIKHVAKTVMPPNVVNVSGQKVIWTKIKLIKLQL